jgi:hypothetical protein
MPTVSRGARLLDLAALASILLGAAFCLWANAQMIEIGKLSYRHPGPPSVSALAAADRARYLAYGGTALILAGCAIGVTSAISHSRQKALKNLQP